MKSLFLFFAFLSIYFILVLLGNFEIDFSSFFLGNALQNKTLIFTLIGIGIFWSGKEVIDKSSLLAKNRYSSSISILFLFSIFCITLGSILGQEFLGFNIPNYQGLGILNFLQLNINQIVLLNLIFGCLLFYNNQYQIEQSIQKENEYDISKQNNGKEDHIRNNYKVNIIKSITKSIYSGDKWVNIGLLIGFIIGCIIIIFLAQNQAIHVDDMYTYSAVKGYNLYGEYKLNIIGLHYEFPLLFLYCVTKFYNLGIFLGFSEIFSLRLFNVILTILFLALNIIFLNLYNIKGKLKVIIFTLIVVNVPIISTLLIARLYPINVIFIISSLYLAFQLIKTQDIRYKLYYFIGIFFIGVISWFFHRVGTVHILILLICVFIHLVYIFISKYKIQGLKYIAIIGIISLGNLGILLLLRPNTITFVQQMMFGNEKVAIINFFQSLLTFFQGINFVLIGIAFIGLTFMLGKKKLNNRAFLGLTLYFIILTYIIHKYFLASRTDNIRYMVDISYIFLIMFLYSFFYIFKFLGKQNYTILLIIFIPLYLVHNIDFLIKTNNKTFSYFQMRNFGLQEKFYLDNNKFNGETLVTDLWLPSIEKSNTVYFITSTKNSDLQSVNNLSKTIDKSDQYRVETDLNRGHNKDYNKEYISQHFPEGKYIYDKNQDFIIKSGMLNIMNKEHLEKIIQKDGKVHILVGFTFFDNWHIDQEKSELRNYIFENCNSQVYKTIENEIYINTPLFWKHNNQLMFYCVLEK